MATKAERQAKITEVIESLTLNDPHCGHVALDTAERFLLVETNRYDGSAYVTVHESAEAAAQYHDRQEYPEDWPIQTLIDLDSDARFSPITTTTWEPTVELAGVI